MGWGASRATVVGWGDHRSTGGHPRQVSVYPEGPQRACYPHCALTFEYQTQQDWGHPGECALFCFMETRSSCVAQTGLKWATICPGSSRITAMHLGLGPPPSPSTQGNQANAQLQPLCPGLERTYSSLSFLLSSMKAMDSDLRRLVTSYVLRVTPKMSSWYRLSSYGQKQPGHRSYGG